MVDSENVWHDSVLLTSINLESLKEPVSWGCSIVVFNVVQQNKFVYHSLTISEAAML